jgi:hypothetical protein
MIQGQMAVTSARTNHHCRAVGLGFIGKENRQRGLIRRLVAFCSRRPVGPKQFPPRLGGKRPGRKCDYANQKEENSAYAIKSEVQFHDLFLFNV